MVQWPRHLYRDLVFHSFVDHVSASITPSRGRIISIMILCFLLFLITFQQKIILSSGLVIPIMILCVASLLLITFVQSITLPRGLRDGICAWRVELTSLLP